MMQSEEHHVISPDHFLKLLDDPDFQKKFLLSHLSRSYDRSIKRILNIAERELGVELDSHERISVARKLRMRLDMLEYEREVERRGNLLR